MDSLYADHAVQQRLAEFLGGDSLVDASALYITRSDGCQFQRSELLPLAQLPLLLHQGRDIARSLADHRALLLHLDVEYVHFDQPAAAFLHPQRAFALQEPAVHAIQSLLLACGIAPLHLLTGQGHHFVWQIDAASPVAARIAALNPAPELVDACQRRLGPNPALAVSRPQQTTFASLALLMEFLAHLIKRTAAPASTLPIEITAVLRPPAPTGQRELVSIDISEYGDPLQTRMVRMPFTHYLKPWATGLAQKLGIEPLLKPIVAIPLHEMDVSQALRCRQNQAEVHQLARRAPTRIPFQEKGTARLLDAYLLSPLRRFHQHFYSALHDPPEQWPHTYHQTPLAALPPCARLLLQQPNDRLLKPVGIQLICRVLLAHGWHPRHIAGLIRSKFENPQHGWGVNWQDYEAGTRADFYTRLFLGQWATGTDHLADFSCAAIQGADFCPLPLSSPSPACSLDPLPNLPNLPNLSPLP